nr:acetate kinase [Noviherbaspirillum sedimenti]
MLTHGLAQGSDVAGDTPERQALQRRLAEQIEQINALKRAIAKQEADLVQLRRAVTSESLNAQRGRGPADPAQQPQGGQAAQAPQDGQAVQTAQAAQGGPVGQAPQQEARPPEVAQIFDQPGVLTPRGKYVLEPSLQYSYSSANRVALIGYTVIPALLIGLIDVREVKRNTFTAALATRFGLTNRLEVEARIPYVYRSDSTVSREVGTGSANDTDRTFSASGRQIGDVELGMRYQLNDGGIDKPYYIGTLRFKSRTGRDPFEVVTDCVQRCVGNSSGTGLPLELPTGSGFYSLQGGLTWLFPSDPAVFFGSVTYLHNFKRSNVSRTVLNGEREFLGSVEPGGIFGFNFGMGLGLNDRTSFSIGYDHNSVGRTKLNGQVVPGSVRTQLGTLLLGYSYRINDRRTLAVSLGAGLTRDTPDITLSVKLPISN